jgi:hypothetical protein
VSGPLDEIISEKRPDVVENSGVAGGMKTMAAIVQALSTELEAPRVSAGDVSLLNNGYACQIQAA